MYSLFTFIQGIGMLFGYLITTYFCTYIKIYILLGLCVLSLIFGCIGFLMKKRKSHAQSQCWTKMKEQASKKNGFKHLVSPKRKTKGYGETDYESATCPEDQAF